MIRSKNGNHYSITCNLPIYVLITKYIYIYTRMYKRTHQIKNVKDKKLEKYKEKDTFQKSERSI